MMIVPRYWAESRVQHRTRNRQVTVRRFGWSDESEAAAQQWADARAREALEAILAGSRTPRQELKRAYDGTDGVPIREEVIARRGEHVVTRNGYGALCLNTPDVMFADVDHGKGRPWGCLMLGNLVALVPMVLLDWVPLVILIASTGTLLLGWLWELVRKRWQREDGELRRIRAFFTRHRELSAMLYKTPRGYRLLFVHGRVDPRSEETARWFTQLGTDPTFVTLCQKQHCFRARVSPKPWRIGLSTRLRKMVWPIPDERRPERDAWVGMYEEASRPFAACRFIQRLGDGPLDPTADALCRWHDELARAHSGLPIA